MQCEYIFISKLSSIGLYLTPTTSSSISFATFNRRGTCFGWHPNFMFIGMAHLSPTGGAIRTNNLNTYIVQSAAKQNKPSGKLCLWYFLESRSFWWFVNSRTKVGKGIYFLGPSDICLKCREENRPFWGSRIGPNFGQFSLFKTDQRVQENKSLFPLWSSNSLIDSGPDWGQI